MTLLPTATHIDIATAMALWILADHSQLGGGKNDINKILTKAKKAACFLTDCPEVYLMFNILP